MLKTTVLMMSLFFNSCNLQALEQNFCEGIEDNLSCPTVAALRGNCFPRNSLCNGTQECSDGADEGAAMPDLICGESLHVVAVMH